MNGGSESGDCDSDLLILGKLDEKEKTIEVFTFFF
jgi:hypothetical protein